MRVPTPINERANHVSDYYFVELWIEDPHDDAVEDIQAAVTCQWWPFREWFTSDDFSSWAADAPYQLHSAACGELSVEESEFGFVSRLTRAIWAANGDYCKVVIHMTCINRVPSNNYAMSELAYDEFLKQQESNA